jgi:hypothetical protein
MDFETKSSGEKMQFSTGMQRDVSKGKPAFHLITPQDLPYNEQMLTRWGNLMARGAGHYGSRNWEKAETTEELDRFMESAFHHFMQWFCGETDEDHAAGLMFNITGAEYVKYKLRSKFHIHKQYPMTPEECFQPEGYVNDDLAHVSGDLSGITNDDLAVLKKL